MAKYKVTISGVFDSDTISNNSDKLILHLVRNCCPVFFGFNVGEACSMSNCMGCWENALEKGLKRVKNLYTSSSWIDAEKQNFIYEVK